MKKIGILAFQGDFFEHQRAVESLGQKAILVNQIKDLNKVDYLIIPGGESTVIGKFLLETKLGENIKNRVKIQKDLFVYGSCAGAILLCKKVISKQKINNLDLIEATISRNSYGSQINSFEQSLEFLPQKKYFRGIFIRAPKITYFNPKKTEILVNSQDQVFMLKQNSILISTFHPELIRPALIHEYFLNKMEK
jgi:pyridoxal 5'-phosphate synthase pdxT subunit